MQIVVHALQRRVRLGERAPGKELSVEIATGVLPVWRGQTSIWRVGPVAAGLAAHSPGDVAIVIRAVHAVVRAITCMMAVAFCSCQLHALDTACSMEQGSKTRENCPTSEHYV